MTINKSVFSSTHMLGAHFPSVVHKSKGEKETRNSYLVPSVGVYVGVNPAQAINHVLHHVIHVTLNNWRRQLIVGMFAQNKLSKV